MKKRVRIPLRNVSQLLELAKKVRTKHLADGEASPLKVLDWTALNTVINEATEMEDLALTLKREKLRVYSQRAIRMEAVLGMVRSSRDLLTAVHPNAMKELGLWGFDVLENKVQLPEPDETNTVKA